MANVDMASSDLLKQSSPYEPGWALSKRKLIFEDRIVSLLFTAPGEKDELRMLKNKHRAATGSSLLSLDWFDRTFPRFPITLRVPEVCSPLKGGWTDLFGPFKHFPLYRLYREHPLSSIAFKREGYFGLAIPSPSGYPLLFHNDFPIERNLLGEARIERVYGRSKIRLVVEPLYVVAQSITKEWLQTTV